MRRRSRVALAIGVLLWFAAIAAAVVPLLGGHAGRRGLQGAPALTAICPGLEVGVHATLAFEPDAGRRTAALAAIHGTLRAQVVRDTLLWNQIEPVRGKRDWRRLDSVIGGLRADGIEPLLVVLGSPSWANGVPSAVPGHYLAVPRRGRALDAWLDRYADFLAAAVRRYKGAVRRWEIWNEPNLAHFWRPRPDPRAYREVYQRLRATIMRVDPQARVAVGGLTNLTRAARPDIAGIPFLRRLSRTRPPIGFVAVHPYATHDDAPTVHHPGENNFDDIARVHDLLARERDPAAIWVTEWGWSSRRVGAGRQARYVGASLNMIERRYPYVHVATYFTDHDLPPRYFQGLLDARLQPKPAAAVLRSHAEVAAQRCAAKG